MKNTFLFLILIAVVQCTQGQTLSTDFKVDVSDPYKVIDAGSKEYLGLDDGNALIVKMGRGIVNIQKFNTQSMTEISRNTYKDLPNGSVFQNLIKTKDKIYYFYYVYNKSDKNFQLYAREIDPVNATFLDQKLILTSSRKVVTPVKLSNIKLPSIRNHKFSFYNSYDQTKIMISYRLYPINKKDKENYDEIGIYVFDQDLNKIVAQETKMPYTEANMSNLSYTVSNNGIAIMLVANKINKSYEMFTIDSEGKLHIKDLGLNSDQLIMNISMKENSKGNFVCGGYYANGLEFDFFTLSSSGLIFNANGLFYMEIDAQGNIIHQGLFEFPKELIMQFLSEKQRKNVEKREAKGKAGILNLELLKQITKSDGSTLFLGEEQYVVQEYIYTPNGSKQKTEYHFANIVLIKISANGELKWMKKLPKNQMGTKGLGQLSIAYMEGKKADYIAFVDNPKNINLKPNEGVPSPHIDGRGGFLTTYKVNMNNGEVEKHTICELEDIKGIRAYQVKTNRIFRVRQNTFLMEVYIKKKQDAMIKFELVN